MGGGFYEDGGEEVWGFVGGEGGFEEGGVGVLVVVVIMAVVSFDEMRDWSKLLANVFFTLHECKESLKYLSQ